MSPGPTAFVRYLGACEVVSRGCGLHVVIHLLAICVSSEKYPFKASAQFLIGVFSVLVLTCKCSLDIWIKVPYQV